MVRKYKRKKIPGVTTALPKRIETHEIDTMAVRLVDAMLPKHLMRRDLHDRDYGIDMLIEVFKGSTPTGTLMLLQIKGHGAQFPTPIVMQIPVKTLLYARLFAAPFFLITVSLAEKKAHYVWLQKYVATRLALDSPKWRTQDKVNISFPPENLLDADGLDRMVLLAGQHARRNIGLEFLYHFASLRQQLDEYRSGNGDDFINAVLIHSSKLKDLDDFAELYAEFVEPFDLIGLHQMLQKAAQYRGTPLDDHDEEFIDSQISALKEVQDLFLAGDDIEQFLIENASDHALY